jgi:hypothetical protein
MALTKRFRYHVAFSYSSADAEYVGRVSAALPEGINHFDYRTDASKAEMWGRDLEKQLVHVYKNAALFCVVFLSKDYVANKWTQLERKVASRVAKAKPGYVLPVLLDDTEVPEIANLIWINRVPPEELAELIAGAIRRPPPRPWWFYLSLEVKVAAAAALLALILFAWLAFNNRPSRTSIRGVQANEQAITVHIANSSQKKATLVGQRLKFGALPIEDAELRLDKSESATIAPGGRDVKLTAVMLEPKCHNGRPLNRAQIDLLLDRHTIILEVDVRESDDAPGQKTLRTATVPAARLKLFVRKWVPVRVPRFASC